MRVTVRTYFDGKEIKVPTELKEHEPTEVTLIFGEETVKPDKSCKGLPLLEQMIEISKKMTGVYPEDLAENHDHYLYGRPKR